MPGERAGRMRSGIAAEDGTSLGSPGLMRI